MAVVLLTGYAGMVDDATAAGFVVLSKPTPPMRWRALYEQRRPDSQAAKNKRSYWSGRTLDDDAEKWLAGAKSVPGSWWTHWSHWLKPKAGKAITARRKLGSKKYPVIEAAPGRYVKAQA